MSPPPGDHPARGWRRSPTDEERATYARDGVVCLRDVIDPDVVLGMADAVADTLTDRSVTSDMTEMGGALRDAFDAPTLEDDAVTPTGPRGQFLSGVDHWRVDPRFADFASTSAVPAIVGELLGANALHLYEDSVLVKQPGTREETAFHQDLAYFHLDGPRICTTWVPLDRVTAETGAVVYLRGSHLDETAYRPNYFVTRHPLDGTDGELVPDIRPDDDRPDLVSFEAGPGDVVIHHARTLHGARGNRSTDRTRRAISIRYCADGTTYRIRRGAPTKPHHDAVRTGDPVVDVPGCPVVWQR